MPNSPAGQVSVALLRAVNVSGTGKLPMADLRALCAEIGFEDVRTYIQSGNVVFRSTYARSEVKTRLERALQDYAGKPVGALIRDGAALETLLQANPLPDAAPNHVLVVFADDLPSEELSAGAKGLKDEQILRAGGEVFVHFPNGMGRSRLRLPVMDIGTGRNLNTVSRLAKMVREVGGR